MRLTLTTLMTTLLMGAALSACDRSGTEAQDAATSQPAASDSAATDDAVEYTAEEIAAETDRINTWFDEKFEEFLEFSPITKTFLGRDTDQDKLDDFSIEGQDKQLEWFRAVNAEMRATFDYNKLSPEAKTSWDISNYQLEQQEAGVPFRSNGYVFDQMSAIHGFFPQLLIAFHKVEDGGGHGQLPLPHRRVSPRN